MISPTLTFKASSINAMCAVCISDNNGGKIALLIIISALILLAVANWAWKKYFPNKKQIFNQK